MTPSAPDWVPATCALPSSEQPRRLAEFDAFFADYARAVERNDARHLTVTLPAAGVVLARDLAARESRCCSFFTFTVTAPPGAVDAALQIAVPGEHTDTLDTLYRRIIEVSAGAAT